MHFQLPEDYLKIHLIDNDRRINFEYVNQHLFNQIDLINSN